MQQIICVNQIGEAASHHSWKNADLLPVVVLLVLVLLVHHVYNATCTMKLEIVSVKHRTSPELILCLWPPPANPAASVR